MTADDRRFPIMRPLPIRARVVPDPYGRPERNRAELEWKNRHAPRQT